MGQADAKAVRLRPVHPDDLPRLCDLQLDPDSNRIAVSIPRSAEDFQTHWAKVLVDPAYTVRAILADEVLVGTITRFPRDGQDHIGYWIDRAYWGKGIASRALEMMLRVVTTRPLYATVAMSNGASLRLLQKCGFLVERVYLSPTSERFMECEKAVLTLG